MQLSDNVILYKSVYDLVSTITLHIYITQSGIVSRSIARFSPFLTQYSCNCKTVVYLYVGQRVCCRNSFRVSSVGIDFTSACVFRSRILTPELKVNIDSCILNPSLRRFCHDRTVPNFIVFIILEKVFVPYFLTANTIELAIKLFCHVTYTLMHFGFTIN